MIVNNMKRGKERVVESVQDDVSVPVEQPKAEAVIEVEAPVKERKPRGPNKPKVEGTAPKKRTSTTKK